MKHNDRERRSFLKTIIAGSAVAAITAVSSNSAKATKKATTKKHREDVLYSETEAFKRYYETL